MRPSRPARKLTRRYRPKLVGDVVLVEASALWELVVTFTIDEHRVIGGAFDRPRAAAVKSGGVARGRGKNPVKPGGPR